MKKKIFLSFVIILIAAAGGYYVVVMKSHNVTATCQKITEPQTTITYTKDKTFTPDCITSPVGLLVTWKNDSDDILELAPDLHPIHNGNKEISNGQFSLTIFKGTSETTKITKSGKSPFHDHKNPFAKGVIEIK